MRRRRVTALTLAALLPGCGGVGVDLDPVGRTARSAGDGRAEDRRATGSPGSDATATGAADAVTSSRSATGSPLDRPAGVRLRNATTRDRYATVVVWDGDRELAAHSTEIPPGSTVTLPALVADAGRYRVAVETAGGQRGRTDWRAVPPIPDLAIDLRPDVRFSRLARCGPDCPPLSTVRTGPDVPGESSDAAADPPDATNVDDGLSGKTATLALENDSDRPSTASVRATSAGDLVLDADYRVPAASRLDVRVPRRVRYRVTVTVDGWPASFEWPAASMARLAVDVADSAGPRFRCRGVYRDLVVENRDATPRTVAVEIRTDGDVALRRPFELAPGASQRLEGAIPPGGRYDAVVETAEGFRRAYAWEVCPPLGPVRVVAVAGDEVRVSVRERTTGSPSWNERPSARSVPGTRDPE